MKNFEYWEKEIDKILQAGKRIAVINDKPVPCFSAEKSCAACFVDCGNSNKLVKWLYAEHVEPPKIRKRTKMFFDLIETGWVARDKNGNLFLYPYIKPYKLDDETEEGWVLNEACNFMLLTGLSFLTLDFIKWEDAEPWSVEDIRELEVEE